MAEIKTPKKFSHLTAISSLDGRFRGRVEQYSKYFSEFATIRGRAEIEIEYLIALLREIGKPVSKNEEKVLRNILKNFDITDARKVWRIDEKINHDAKAVEIYLAKKLKENGLSKYINYLHFGLTTMDIDYTTLALSLKGFINEEYISEIKTLIKEINKLAKKQSGLVMPARTHGKIAVPTKVEFELQKFEYRLNSQLAKLKKIKIGSKVSGAVGNHNALYAAYPTIDWHKFSDKFLKSLGLVSYPKSTQIEPLENKVELFQAVKRVNSVVIALDTDIWRYLALGYLSLRDDSGHVGSSTMPQKINPIGFELSESYLHMANGILGVFEYRLPLNRWQRDLTDKYLLRDLGQALVMSIFAINSTKNALSQIGFNKEYIEKDLDDHWEIIAEGVQTILRTTDYPDPYNAVKELTRGKKVTKETYEKFIDAIDVAEEIKTKLKKLSPHTYIGRRSNY